MGREKSSQQIVWEQLDIHMQKEWIWPPNSHHIKTQSESKKCFAKDGEKLEPLYNARLEWKMVQLLYKTIRWLLKKLNQNYHLNKQFYFWVYIHKKWKQGLEQIFIYKPTFIAALFTTAKKWKQSKCPLRDEWIKKMCHIHTIEYYPVLEKKGTISYATTWMNLKDIMLNEISWAQGIPAVEQWVKNLTAVAWITVKV